MSSLSETIARLNAAQFGGVGLKPGLNVGGLSGAGLPGSGLAGAGLRGMGVGGLGGGGDDRLVDLDHFGSDPGQLRARTFVPAGLADGAALVVVLHGCTQDAAGYDAASGWSRLADRHGFAVLLPEQRRANNGNGCFNWFEAGDVRRDGGEIESIRQMVAHMVAAHRLDRARVFVTGLSAGGAMAAALLATCPDIFAGGAVIAGLPSGVATSVGQAMAMMRGQGLPNATSLAASTGRAVPTGGRWPTLSVWHGTADTTVVPANGEALVAQWLALHDLPAAPTQVDRVDGHVRRRWYDPAGDVLVEHHAVAGMAHGTPLATTGVDALGQVAPFMLEAGISSTRRIAQGWGLTGTLRPEQAVHD